MSEPFSPPAPRERQQFSKLVSKWENDTALGHNGKTDAFAAWLIPEAIACIREQQAALEEIKGRAQFGVSYQLGEDVAETARAVLAKWRIE